MNLGWISGQLDSEFNPFLDEYLGEILAAVALAWSRMRPARQRGLEDQITLSLAGRLQHDVPFTNLPFDIVPQYWLMDVEGRRLGRLDLHFKYRASKRDYFSFEAKRLHVTYPGGDRISTEYSAYAGDDGMGAYIEGQYSKGLPTAGMLGYVMDGKTEDAWSGLMNRINARREILRLLVELSNCPLAHHISSGLAGSRLGETQHNLESHTLRILHLLLPVVQRGQ